MAKRYSKQLLVFAVLLVLLALLIGIIKINQDARTRAAGQNASLTLTTGSTSLSINENIDFSVFLNTDSAGVTGADVVINFDKNRLLVVNVVPNTSTTLKTFAPLTSAGNFDKDKVITDANTTGRIEFGTVSFNYAGQAATTPYNGITSLATITFRALTAGQTSVSIVMTPGSTTESNIILYASNVSDLLTQPAQVNSVSLDITDVTPTPTNTPLLTPTATLIPTATPIPGGTTVNLTLWLHGIGMAGDNVKPNYAGTMNPLRIQRTVSLDVINNNGQLVKTAQGLIQYNPTSGNFSGTVDIGILSSGLYLFKARSPQFLTRQYPIITNLTNVQQVTMPALTLSTGDVNSDNKINILDYNVLRDCYSDSVPASNCSDPNKKQMADITDDGNVNMYDHNLFIRETSVVLGQ